MLSPPQPPRVAIADDRPAHRADATRRLIGEALSARVLVLSVSAQDEDVSEALPPEPGPWA